MESWLCCCGQVAAASGLRLSRVTSERLWALAAGCVPDVASWEIPRIAREAGFDSSGMWVDPDAGWGKEALRRTHQCLNDTGIELIDVEPLWLEKPEALQKTVVEAGIELGARNVLVVSREPELHLAHARFESLCKFAEGRIRLVLEFGVFTEVKTMSAAIDFVRQVGSETGGVLIDQMHLNRSGEALPDLDDPLFPYIQACDFYADSKTKEGMDYIVAAVDERCPLGEGDASTAQTDAIRDSSLDVSLEIRSKTLRESYPDPVERARQIFQRCPERA